MNEIQLEANFPAHVKVSGKGNEWTAAITRRSDEKTYTITTLEGLTASDCYFKFGVSVPEPEKEPEDAIEAAVKTLREGLTALSGRTIVPSAELSDLFLDAINQLGKTNAGND